MTRAFLWFLGGGCGVVKISRGPAGDWAESVQLRLHSGGHPSRWKALLAHPCQACWPPVHPPTGRVRASGAGAGAWALADTERRAPHLPTTCPSVLHKARQRAGEIADISGPWAIYQEETEWDTRSFLPTFHTAVTAGSTPGPRWHRGHQTNHKGRSSRVSEEQHSQCFPQKYPKIFNFPVMCFLIFWSSSSQKQFFLKMFMFLLSTISLFKDTASTYKHYITEPEGKQSWKHNQIRRNYCQ